MFLLQPVLYIFPTTIRLTSFIFTGIKPLFGMYVATKAPPIFLPDWRCVDSASFLPSFSHDKKASIHRDFTNCCRNRMFFNKNAKEKGRRCSSAVPASLLHFTPAVAPLCFLFTPTAAIMPALFTFNSSFYAQDVYVADYSPCGNSCTGIFQNKSIHVPRCL